MLFGGFRARCTGTKLLVYFERWMHEWIEFLILKFLEGHVAGCKEAWFYNHGSVTGELEGHTSVGYGTSMGGRLNSMGSPSGDAGVWDTQTQTSDHSILHASTSQTRHYKAEVLQFAEASGYAVTTVADGKSFFPEDHPQFIGEFRV